MVEEEDVREGDAGEDVEVGAEVEENVCIKNCNI